MRLSRGFTLIELMVVMAIMSTVLGLVGPMVMQQVEKTQAKVEILEMREWLAAIQERAFLRGATLTLSLEGKQAQILNGEQVLNQKEFEYIFFNASRVTFNPMGFPSASAVSYYVGEDLLTLTLAQ